MADLLTAIAGSGGSGAYVSGDKWGYQTAEKVRDNIDTLNATIKTGSGAPESSVSAGVGSLYLRTTAGVGTTLYTKESGSGNTGWMEAGLVKRARVALTNAQVLALHTTAFQLVAAPGSGFTIVPHLVVLQAKFAAGAYTGVDNDGYLVVQYAGGLMWSNYIANINSVPYTQLDVFLDGTNKRTVLREYMDTQDPTLGFGNLAYTYTSRTYDNVALQLKADNISGDWTGGHANNTLTVTTYYSIETVP